MRCFIDAGPPLNCHAPSCGGFPPPFHGMRLAMLRHTGASPPFHGMRLAFTALSQTLFLSPLRRGAGRRSLPGSKTRQGTGACSVDTRVSGPRAPRPILTPPYLPMLKLHLPRSLIRSGSHLLGAVLLVCIGISHSQTAQRLSASPPQDPPMRSAGVQHEQRRTADMGVTNHTQVAQGWTVGSQLAGRGVVRSGSELALKRRIARTHGCGDTAATLMWHAQRAYID